MLFHEGLTGADTYDYEMKLFLNEEDIDAVGKQLPKTMGNPFQKSIGAASKERWEDFGCDDHTKSRNIVKKLPNGICLIKKIVDRYYRKMIWSLLCFAQYHHDDKELSSIWQCSHFPILAVIMNVAYSLFLPGRNHAISWQNKR
jgi:hypothetical protein